jgi:large subunit ribosomal protein L9
MNVEVILRQDVDNLGKAGTLVRVKPGYARNFLVPRGLAYTASDGNKKRIEAEQRSRTQRAQADKDEAMSLASRLGSVHIKLKAKAGEGDKLFGSITTQDLGQTLAAQGFAIDKRKIELDHPIKQLGTHLVSIRLHPDVHAEIKVTVEPA